MLIRDNGKSIYIKNNNPTVIKRNKMTLNNLNNQSRNINNTLIKEKNVRKSSMYSTKDSIQRKDYNKVSVPPSLKNTFYKPDKEKNYKNDLDDTLSQISNILNNNKKDLNYSGMEKYLGINEEPNFVYDLMLYNKSKINKAKILSHKIGVLKLPISKISSKEALTNSSKEKKYFSDRVKGLGDSSKKSTDDDSVGISCCFFGKK